MAPTGTTNSTTNSTSTGAGGSDGTETVSLYIAIAALAISSLLAAMQLLFAYVTSSTGRNKTNAAALGEWHRHTRLSFRQFWKGKLKVSYGVVQLSQDALWKNKMKQAIVEIREYKKLDRYRCQVVLSNSSTKNGMQCEGTELRILRENAAEDIPVPLSELTRSERRAFKKIQKTREFVEKPHRAIHASWPVMASHLNFDLTLLEPAYWEDADTIPLACSAPLTCIRMSDLIVFCYLSDMKILIAIPSTGEILATGPQCKIYSENIPNVGLVCRYDVKYRGFTPAIQMTEGVFEPKILADIAGGALGFGKTVTSMPLLGYNSVLHMVDHFLGNSSGNKWQEVEVAPDRRAIRRDNDVKWKGMYSNPKTSIVAFLMATASTPAIAKAFTHSYLREWASSNLCERMKDACTALQHAGHGLVTPPEEFIPSMFRNNYIKTSSYKVADNHGCEFGGLRGYLCTNLAHFTKCVASCWPYTPSPEHTQHPPVPVLFELRNHIEAGTSLTDWAANHSLEEYSGEHWALTARAALWIQITMLDTWIGVMIDRLMGETALTEVSVPATLEAANACADEAGKLRQSNAFNPVRSRWLKIYLHRLAEGYQGQSESFMSTVQHPNWEERWTETGLGTSSEWLALDAVLTLRAAVMYAMFMILEDSSVLLELGTNDPMLYMS